MLIKTFYFVVTVLSITVFHIDAKARVSAPKTNAVHNFDDASLKKFVKDYKFVMVLYNMPKTKKGKSLAKWYFKAAETHDVNEVFFLQVHLKPKKNKKTFRPRIDMYVYGFHKTYHGDMKAENLHNWIIDVLQASPTNVKTVNSIADVDSHYFVVINEAWLNANRTHLTVLAKLISPLNIFYGLEKTEIDKLTDNKVPTSPLWVFREYNKEIIEVDIHLPLKKKADFILNNEFPAFVMPNPQSYRLLTEFKAPALMYFTKDKDDEFIDIIKTLAKPFRDYFVTMAVVPEKKNKTSIFFKNFMGVNKLPALRILNMQDEVRRFMYMGEFDPTLIEYFLQNYKRDNLKPYTVNEAVKRNQKVDNFYKANHEMFPALLRDMIDANLIYIYSSYGGKSRKHLENLDLIQEVFRENKNFKVYTIDQDKNDLDGHFRQKLPLLILTAPPKQLHHYEGKYDFTSLANFIISKLPHMKLTEPEYEVETGL